jgi:hypothetical protein
MRLMSSTPGTHRNQYGDGRQTPHQHAARTGRRHHTHDAHIGPFEEQPYGDHEQAKRRVHGNADDWFTDEFVERAGTERLSQ